MRKLLKRLRKLEGNSAKHISHVSIERSNSSSENIYSAPVLNKYATTQYLVNGK